MSRGPGIVQKQIIEAFEADPQIEMTADDVVSLLFPDTLAKPHDFSAAARALRTLMPRLGLVRKKAYANGRTFFVYSKANKCI